MYDLGVRQMEKFEKQWFRDKHIVLVV